MFFHNVILALSHGGSLYIKEMCVKCKRTRSCKVARYLPVSRCNASFKLTDATSMYYLQSMQGF